MALTESNPFPLTSIATDFILPDSVSGQTLSLKELKSEKATVIMFICNHCPYVKHINIGLVYHGQMDDSRPSSPVSVTGIDLAAALDLTLAGKPWQGIQKPGIGCGIKWK